MPPIQDPDNPYLQPGPSYVVPPPPAPVPEEPKPEHEEDVSYEQTVANSLASQYPEITPEAGGTYSSDAQAYFDAPSTPPRDSAYTPPPPPSGSEYFDTPLGIGFQADAGDGQYHPEVNYVSNDEYFGNLAQQIGPAPTQPDPSQLFDNSSIYQPVIDKYGGWFGDTASQDQQYQYWQAEMDKATAAGDTKKVNELTKELNDVTNAWHGIMAQQAQTNAFNGMFGMVENAGIGSYNQRWNDWEQALNASPVQQGEGGFSRTQFQIPNDVPGRAEEYAPSTQTATFLQSNLQNEGYRDQLGTPLLWHTSEGTQYRADVQAAIDQIEQQQAIALNQYQRENFLGPFAGEWQGMFPDEQRAYNMRQMLGDTSGMRGDQLNYLLNGRTPQNAPIPQRPKEKGSLLDAINPVNWLGYGADYAESQTQGILGQTAIATQQAARLGNQLNLKPQISRSDYYRKTGVPLGVQDYAAVTPELAKALASPVLAGTALGKFLSDNGVAKTVMYALNAPSQYATEGAYLTLRSLQYSIESPFQPHDADALKGTALLDQWRRDYQRFEETHPLVTIGAQSVLDPLNLVGLGAVEEFLSKGNLALKKLVLGADTLKDLQRTGDLAPELAQAFLDMEPGWSDVWRVRKATDTITDRLLEAGVNLSFLDQHYQFFDSAAKAYVIDLFTNSKRGGATTAGVWQKYMDQALARIEQFGTKADVKVAERVLDRTAPFIERVGETVSTPTPRTGFDASTWLPDDIRIDGRRTEPARIIRVQPEVETTFAPGSRQNRVISDPNATLKMPGIGPASDYRRNMVPDVVYAPGSRRNLATGYVRGRDGNITTVSKRMGEDLAVVQNEALSVQPTPPTTRQLRLEDQPVVAPSTTSAAPPVVVPSPIVEDIFVAPVPPRVVEPTRVFDASAAQVRTIELLNARDGVNYWDQIAEAGDFSSGAITAKIDEINAAGKATPEQLNELLRLKQSPSQIRELAQRDARYVSNYIEELRRGDQSINAVDTRAFLTPDGFRSSDPLAEQRLARNPKPTNNRLVSQAQIDLAYSRGQRYGVDFLAMLAENPEMDVQTFSELLDLGQMPASAEQRRVVRSLIEKGAIKQPVDLQRLSAAEADNLIRTSAIVPGPVKFDPKTWLPEDIRLQTDINPVAAQMEHAVETPYETGSAGEIVDTLADATVIKAKQESVEYLRQHLPRFTRPKGVSVEKAGFRTAVEGQMTPLGVPAMTPFALKDLMLRNAKRLEGTPYENVARDISNVMLHVNADGRLSYSTADAYMEYLVKSIPDIARTADVEDTRILTDIINGAYHDDARVRAIETDARAAADKARSPDQRAEIARQKDLHRQQLPTLQAELARATRDLNMTIIQKPGDKSIAALTERKRSIEKQIEQAQAYLSGPDAPPVTSAGRKMAKRAANRDKINTIAPLGDEPALNQSLAEVAGPASDHDLAQALVTRDPRTVPAEPPQVVKRAERGSDEWMNAYDTVQEYADYINEVIHDPARRAELTAGTPPEVQDAVKMLGLKVGDPSVTDPVEHARSIMDRAFAFARKEMLPDLQMGSGFQPVMDEDRLSDMVANAWAEANKYKKNTKTYEKLRARALELENRRGDSTFWRITRGNGPGIVHPWMQNRIKAYTLLEPSADAWRGADWASIGKHLDAWAEKYYTTDYLLNDEKRLRLAGKEINPLALQKGSRVQKVADILSMDLQRFMDEYHSSPDAVEAVRNRIQTLVSGDLQAIAREDRFYTSSKTGAEALRVWRKYGQQVLDDFERNLPGDTFGKLPRSVFTSQNGYITSAQLKRLDAIMNRRMRPEGMQGADHFILDNFIDAHQQTWNDVVADKFFNPATNSWSINSDAITQAETTLRTAQADVDMLSARKTAALAKARKSGTAADRQEAREISDLFSQAIIERNTARTAVKDAKGADRVHVINDLDALMFPEKQQLPDDVPLLSERIASTIAQSYAKDIGYVYEAKGNPLLKLNQWIKAQLSPLWMTMMPQYHLNNIAGNLGAQVIGSTRHYAGRGPLGMIPDPARMIPKVDRAWARAIEREGSGVGISRYRRAHLIETSGLTDGHPNGHWLDNVPGLGHWKKGGEHVAEFFEGKAKDIISSQQFMHDYNKVWNKELQRLLTDGKISPADLKSLTGVVGLDEVRRLGAGSGSLDELLAAQRMAIARGNVGAYHAASDMLRDYRMRNKIDGFLDNFLPVHFWTTKNMAFMTRAALDRPAMALSAAQFYNAWQKENEGLPPSLRTGYFKVPQEITSNIPGGSDAPFYMRLTNLTNPVLFAVPRMVQQMKGDFEHYDFSNSSLPERLAFLGQDGLKNFWAAAGYRIGPQYDLATKVLNMAVFRNNRDAPFIRALNYVNSPVSGRNSFLPFGGVERLPGLAEMKFLGSDNLQQFYEEANKLVYGTSYTNYEWVLMQKNATFKEMSGEWTHERTRAALEALGRADLNNDDVRQLADEMFVTGAADYWKARGLAVSGKSYTDSWRLSYQANEQYYKVKDAAGKEAADKAIYTTLPAPLQWLYDQRDVGKITQKQIDTLLTKAVRGEDSPWLQRAWDASNNSDWIAAQQVSLIGEMVEGNRQWEKLYNSVGYDEANAQMIGTLDTRTGKYVGGSTPWLLDYQIATGRDNAAAAIHEDDARRNALVLNDRYNQDRRDTSNRAQPYYARMDQNEAALQTVLALAGDNMFKVEAAWKTHDAMDKKIRADAEAAGVPLVGLGNPPQHGGDYYSRSPQERAFLEANGALDAVNKYQTSQAQQGYVIKLITDQLGLKKYITDMEGNSVENPAFWYEDENNDYKLTFSQEKWDAAVKEGMQQAPDLFRQIVTELRDAGYNVVMGVDGKGITPADFEYQVNHSEHPELDKFREDRGQAWADYKQMEAGPAKQARYLEIVQQFGAPQGTEYHDSGDFSAEQNRVYGEGTDKLTDIYYNNMTPRQQEELRNAHPEAFEKKDTGGFSFDATKLTGQTVADELKRRGLNADGSVLGPEKGETVTPEVWAGTQEVQHIHDLTDQYYDTPEAVAQKDYIATTGAGKIEVNGQMTTLEEAAQALIKDDRSKTKAGFPSWKKAASVAGEDTALGQYILTRKEMGDAANTSKQAFLDSLSEADRNLLLTEGSAAIRDDLGGNADTQTTPSQSTGTTPFGASQFKNASSGSTYTSYPKASYSSGGGYSSGGSSYSSGGYSSSQGSATPSFTNAVIALDPLLSTGQDDGRGAIATQVMDHLQRILAPLAFLPNAKQVLPVYQGALLRWLTTKLGDAPTMETWQSLLALLNRMEQQRQGGHQQIIPQSFQRPPTQEIVPQSFQMPRGY